MITTPIVMMIAMMAIAKKTVDGLRVTSPETLALHGGSHRADPTTGSVAVSEGQRRLQPLQQLGPHPGVGGVGGIGGEDRDPRRHGIEKSTPWAKGRSRL